MLQDLLKWILIMAIIVFSFIVSFRTLFACAVDGSDDEHGHASLPLALFGALLTGGYVRRLG